MGNALSKAIAQLGDRRILSVLLASIALAIAVFAALWLGIWFLLTRTAISDQAWIETTLDVLGGLATLALTWLLFPIVVSAWVALFLDRVATAVEQRHYPELPPAPGLPLATALLASLRFLVVALTLNVLLLVLLLLPPAYPVAYYLLNGYLLGREYFELVALRRLDPIAARRLRARHGTELLLTGAGMAFALTIPLVAFVVPVVATAMLVHRYETWRRAG